MAKAKGFLIGAVVGSTLGALSALLFAPKPGKELRADIADQAKAVSEKTQELAKSVGEHTTEWAGKVKDAGSFVLEELRSLKPGKRDASREEELAIVSSYRDDEDIFLDEGESI
ncbi:YtxH domain-containing protein [Gorillibacterium sp. sgz500922]|uniref:YtxH domain-containing protein n=1 Tax=Gorillibacterium sp. sgz500922 TaxID=3446694 RepID=UPI003F663AB4